VWLRDLSVFFFFLFFFQKRRYCTQAVW
jgi:hypothetical protein